MRRGPEFDLRDYRTPPESELLRRAGIERPWTVVEKYGWGAVGPLRAAMIRVHWKLAEREIAEVARAAGREIALRKQIRRKRAATERRKRRRGG